VKPQVKACLEEFGGVYGLKVGDVIEMLCRQAGILQPGVSGTDNSLLGVTTQADIPPGPIRVPDRGLVEGHPVTIHDNGTITGYLTGGEYRTHQGFQADDQGISGGFAQPADPLYDFHLAQDGTLTPLQQRVRADVASWTELPSDLHERVQTQAAGYNHPGEAHNWDQYGRCMICGILDLTNRNHLLGEALTRDNAPLQRQVWLDEPATREAPGPNPEQRIRPECGVYFPHAFTMTGICANCGIQEEHTHQFTNHGTCVICGAYEDPF
jgi:hypothetical protein